jgi:hypothetical protein
MGLKASLFPSAAICMWLLHHVVPCLQLSSAQQLSLFCQGDSTHDRTVFRSYYSSWYSASFTALLLRAITWKHTTWSIMQLILQSEAGPFEGLWNIMKTVQGKLIYSDFCNLVTINMNFTKKKKKWLWKWQVHWFICCYSITENTVVEITVLSRCTVIFRKHTQQEQ